MKAVILAVAILFVPVCISGDAEVARAMASSGAALALKGSTDKAEDLLCRALAIDSNCGEAMFELAKVYDLKKNHKLSAELYFQCVSKVEDKAKSAYAMSRLMVIDRPSYDLIVTMERHAKSIEDVVKRFPDKITLDAAQADLKKIDVASVIPKSSAPSLDKVKIVYPQSPVVGMYYYVGPWWKSDFDVRENHTFMRIPVMIGGTWTVDGETLKLKHSDGTLDVLTRNANGYSNSRVSITRKTEKQGK